MQKVREEAEAKMAEKEPTEVEAMAIKRLETLEKEAMTQGKENVEREKEIKNLQDQMKKQHTSELHLRKKSWEEAVDHWQRTFVVIGFNQNLTIR